MSFQKHSNQNYSSPPLSSNTSFVVKSCPGGGYSVTGKNSQATWAAVDCIFTCVHGYTSGRVWQVTFKAVLIGDSSWVTPDSTHDSFTQIVFHKGFFPLHTFSNPWRSWGSGYLCCFEGLTLPHACCTIVAEPATKERGVFWWVLWNFRLNLSTTTGRFKQEHAALLMTHYLGRTWGASRGMTSVKKKHIPFQDEVLQSRMA